MQNLTHRSTANFQLKPETCLRLLRQGHVFLPQELASRFQELSHSLKRNSTTGVALSVTTARGILEVLETRLIEESERRNSYNLATTSAAASCINVVQQNNWRDFDQSVATCWRELFGAIRGDSSEAIALRRSCLTSIAKLPLEYSKRFLEEIYYDTNRNALPTLLDVKFPAAKETSTTHHSRAKQDALITIVRQFAVIGDELALQRIASSNLHTLHGREAFRQLLARGTEAAANTARRMLLGGAPNYPAANILIIGIIKQLERSEKPLGYGVGISLANLADQLCENAKSGNISRAKARLQKTALSLGSVLSEYSPDAMRPNRLTHLAQRVYRHARGEATIQTEVRHQAIDIIAGQTTDEAKQTLRAIFLLSRGVPPNFLQKKSESSPKGKSANRRKRKEKRLLKKLRGEAVPRDEETLRKIIDGFDRQSNTDALKVAVSIGCNSAYGVEASRILLRTEGENGHVPVQSATVASINPNVASDLLCLLIEHDGVSDNLMERIVTTTKSPLRSEAISYFVQRGITLHLLKGLMSREPKATKDSIKALGSIDTEAAVSQLLSILISHRKNSVRSVVVENLANHLIRYLDQAIESLDTVKRLHRSGTQSYRARVRDIGVAVRATEAFERRAASPNDRSSFMYPTAPVLLAGESYDRSVRDAFDLVYGFEKTLPRRGDPWDPLIKYRHSVSAYNRALEGVAEMLVNLSSSRPALNDYQKTISALQTISPVGERSPVLLRRAFRILHAFLLFGASIAVAKAENQETAAQASA